MKSPGAKTKLLTLFRNKVGESIDKNTLAKVAGVHDWARIIRTLRQEGYQIELLKNGSYRLNSLKQKGGVVRGAIDARTRYRILHRDNSTCQRCGATPVDGIKLVVDHKTPVEWGGKTVDENLWTLCESCNLGKKHWFRNEDPGDMKKILTLSSGRKRMELYFELHPNELIEPSTLDLVSGIRDWERTLRAVRQSGKRIVYYKKHKKTDKEGYVYEK